MSSRPLRNLALLLLLTGCQSTPGPSPAQPSATGLALQPLKTIPVGKTPHGLTAAGGYVYNSNIGDNTLSIIDTRQDTVTETIPVKGTPGYSHAFRDHFVLVNDTKNGQLMVFDTSKGHALVQTIAVGKGPDKIRHTDDEHGVLISLTGESKLVELTFGDEMTKPPTRKEYAIGSNPGENRALAVEAGWALAPDAGDNQSSLINLANGTVKTLVDGNAPGPVAIGASSDMAVAAIVGNTASSTVTLFAIPSGEKVTLADVGLSPSDALVDTDLHRAFVTMSGSNQLAVIDYLTRTVVGKVTVGSRPVHVYEPPAIVPQLMHEHQNLSHEIWVGNDGSDTVSVVDGDSLRVKATIAVGRGHHKMAFFGSKAYVSNITSNDVSVIDRTGIK